MPDYLIKIGSVQAGARHSINFFHTATSARVAVKNFEDECLTQYLGMLDQLTVVRYISARNALGTRDTYTKKMDKQGTQVSATPSFADVAKTAAVFKLYGANGTQRSLTIRGLTDSAVVRDERGVNQPSEEFIQKFQPFMDSLTENFGNLAIRENLRPGSGTNNEWYSIKNIEPEPDTDNKSSIIQTKAAHGFNNGDRVIFSIPQGVPQLLPYRGVFNLVEPEVSGSTTKFVLAAQYVGEGATFVPPKQMKVRKLEYRYNVIEDWTWDKFSSRDTADIEGSRGAGRRNSYRNRS